MASTRENLENQLFGDASLDPDQKKRMALELLQQLDEENRKQMMLRFDVGLQNELMKSPEFRAMNQQAPSDRGPEGTSSPQVGSSSNVSGDSKLDSMRKKFSSMKRPLDPVPPPPLKKSSVQFSGAGPLVLQDLSTHMERKYSGFKGDIKKNEQAKRETLDYSFTERDCQYNGTLDSEGVGNITVINNGDWTHRDVDEFVDHLCNDLQLKSIRIEQETVYPISMMVKACEILEARGVSLTIYKYEAPEGTPDTTIDDLKEDLQKRETKKSCTMRHVDAPVRYQEFLKLNMPLESDLIKSRVSIVEINKLSKGSEEDRQQAIELVQRNLNSSAKILEIHREEIRVLKECVASGELTSGHPHIQNKEKKMLESIEAHTRLIRRSEKYQKRLEAGETLHGKSRSQEHTSSSTK
jgi:hypothetical protein